MFSFFEPVSKVQKDRRIMRETDARMAKYSRRGLVFNFLAFLVCLIGGHFIEQNRDLTVVLTTGLLLITFVRGFFLFRFEHLYPRAPARWRNSYFVATLIGAIWWGVIMCSVTITLKMEYEAPLFWLYTVVFFSTTAHAFAPYQKFLAYYQFFGLMPAAVAAFTLGISDGYLYGTLLLVFFLVLIHQCRLMSENYWEKLEASYALSRKTLSIEEEKRDTRASAKLNREFLGYLRSDLWELISQNKDQLMSLSEVPQNADSDSTSTDTPYLALRRLFNNISDFNSVLSKELTLSNRVFNIRHELQHTIADVVAQGELKGIDIESALSPNLPMRLRGDASRLAQVVKTILHMAIRDLNSGAVIIEAEFLREYENAGELYITISRVCDTQKRLFFSDKEQTLVPKAGLDFAVCKGIAEIMEGNIEITEIPREGVQYRFNAKMDLAEASGQLDFHRNSFAGHKVLLIHSNARIVDIKRRELESLGFVVTTETQYKRAEQILLNSYKTDAATGSVLFYADDEDAMAFNNKLVEHEQLRHTHQLIVASPAKQNKLVKEGYIASDQVHFVDRPAGLFELECAYHMAYGLEDKLQQKEGELRILNYSNSETVDAGLQTILEVFDDAVVQANNEQALLDYFRKNATDVSLILIDTKHVPNYIRVIDEIREHETKEKYEVFVPIVGIAYSQEDINAVAYELGIDDFIQIGQTHKNAEQLIRYWAALH